MSEVSIDVSPAHVNEEIPEALSLNLFDSNGFDNAADIHSALPMKVEIAFSLSSFPGKDIISLPQHVGRTQRKAKGKSRPTYGTLPSVIALGMKLPHPLR